MRKIFVATICLVFLFSAFVFASRVEAQIILGHITGTVTGATTGSPIGGATVTAKIGSSVNGTANTNETGYYDISGLNGNFAGIVYEVTASKTGYQSFTVNVTMYSSIDFVVSKTKDFTLTPLPTPVPTPTPAIPELPDSPILVAILVASSLVLLLVRFAKNPRPLLE